MNAVISPAVHTGYPKLIEGVKSGNIYLLYSRYKGVLVALGSSTNNGCSVGFQYDSTDFEVPGNYKPFTGSVTLSN